MVRAVHAQVVAREGEHVKSRGITGDIGPVLAGGVGLRRGRGQRVVLVEHGDLHTGNRGSGVAIDDADHQAIRRIHRFDRILVASATGHERHREPGDG